MDVYYKGEDVSLTMTLFEDEKGKTPIKVANYLIDVVLYTSAETAFVHASNSVDAPRSTIPIDMESVNIIKLIIDQEHLETLSTGQVMMEMRLRDKINGRSKILKNCIFSLADTIIKTI